MKTLVKCLMLLSILISFSACNENNDNLPDYELSDSGPQFYIHVSFIDKTGNDIVKTIEKTPMTLAMSNGIMTTDEATYFKIEDYQMETYLNGKLIEPAEPFKYHFISCLLDEKSINGKTAIELIASGAEEVLKSYLKNSQDFGKHSIEWHFTCPKLFGDNEKHVFKLNFKLIKPYLGGGFQGELYFDNVRQELYYPEYYGISPTYSIEGRDVTTPYCIINL